MNKLTLLLYLYVDQSDPTKNTLVSRMQALGQRSGVSLLMRDGVIRLADNAVLFDHAKAHDVYTQVCSDIQSVKRTYLLLPICSDNVLAVGEFPKEVSEKLANYEIAFIPPLLTSR